MSGICGIVRIDGKAVDARDLDRQVKRLEHLGPDRVGRWRQGPAAMAHLMMRITREDSSDAQPLTRGALSLVADVRLDNREDLAQALTIDAGALAAMSDSALLFEAYGRWGADCVDRLVGDFAFAVWDGASKTLTLARDHMGQRHIFYHQGDGFFSFASEIKGLWALPEVPRVLLEESLARHFLFEDNQDPGATLFEGIRGVAGGRIATLAADGSLSTRCYWEPHADPIHVGRDEAYYVETYRKVLAEAVACRLRRTIAPAGLMMGAGFDSGGICAVAGAVLAAKGQKLVTVSSVMPESYQGTIRDVRPWAETFRRHMPHLDLRYVTLEGLDTLTFMEDGFLGCDNRHGAMHYGARAILQEVRRAGARVVMDGHGGNYTLNPLFQRLIAGVAVQGPIRPLPC